MPNVHNFPECTLCDGKPGKRIISIQSHRFGPRTQICAVGRQPAPKKVEFFRITAHGMVLRPCVLEQHGESPHVGGGCVNPEFEATAGDFEKV